MSDDIDRLLKTIDDAIERGCSFSGVVLNVTESHYMRVTDER